MTFRSRHLCWAAKLNKRRHRDTLGNQPHFRHLFSTCQVGYLNVCTLRHVFNVSPDGSLFLSGFAEMEILKQRMQDHSLYALCVSEVRLFGAGSVDVGTGFTLVYQGSLVMVVMEAVAFYFRLLAPKVGWFKGGRLFFWPCFATLYEACCQRRSVASVFGEWPNHAALRCGEECLVE